MEELRFSEKDIDDLRKVLSVPTCIIIMGQDSYGKAAVVTRLLKEQVLPLLPHCVQPDSDSNENIQKPWRPIRIRHGIERKCCVALPSCDSEKRGYECAGDCNLKSEFDMAPHSKIELDNDQLNVSMVGFQFFNEIITKKL